MNYKLGDNLPGPGDHETWGPVTHPSDPRYNDPTESPAFEEMKDTLYRERIQDFNGYFIESFGEASDEWLKELSQLVLKWSDAPTDRIMDIEITIGRMVASRIADYCTPPDDEVLDAIQGDGGE